MTLASETGADIYYTTDGSPAVAGDLPGDNAKLYTAPIPITAANTEVHAVAFDRAGNLDTVDRALLAVDRARTGARRADHHRRHAGARVRSRSTGRAVTGATSYQVTRHPGADRRPAGQPPPPGPRRSPGSPPERCTPSR